MKDPARYKAIVPEADRKLFDPDAWLSAAVALDVLSTRLGAIDPRALYIDEVVRAAVEVGILGGLDDGEVDALLAEARDEIGDARAEVAPLLTQPRDLQRAVKLVRDGARTMVREARLELEAGAMTTYRQV
ncbi:MAG: hypothetical protein ACAI38_08985 [Myxococcota bacterium]